MKTIRTCKLGTLLLAALALASCSKEPDGGQTPDAPVPITVTAAMPGQNDATAQTAASQAAANGTANPAANSPTRAVADPTQALTLYFVRNDQNTSGAYTGYGTTAITAARAAGTGAQALTFSPAQYYPALGRKVKLTGWYPAAKSFTGGVVTWDLDGATDILTAPAKEGSLTAARMSFVFGHALAQVRFMPYAENADAQAAWGAISSITVTAQPATCTYTPASDDGTGAVAYGALTASYTVKNWTTAMIPVGADKAVQRGDPVLVAAPATEYNLRVTVASTGNGTVTAIVPARVYKPGSVTGLKLKFTPFGISVTAFPWEDIGQDVGMGGKPEINLSARGTANCYIASKVNVNYSFDATKQGNDVGMDGVPLSAIAPQSANVFWQTGKVIEDGSVKLEDGRVKFALDPDFKLADGGSALIAVYASADGSGGVLWSWHIWATNYNPDAIVAANSIAAQNTTYTASGATGQVHTYGPEYWKVNSGKAIMDRYLGAEKALYEVDPKMTVDDNWPTYGFLYQWGRKDPFPGAEKGVTGSDGAPRPLFAANGTTDITSTAFRIGNGKQTIQTGVSNPGAFYWTDFNDWVDVSTDNLWTGTTGKKTAFDPCPPGWRVAPNGTWGDFGSSNFQNGRWYGNQVTGGKLYTAGSVSAWYPAMGYRDNGALSSVGGTTFCYTSGADLGCYSYCFSYNSSSGGNSIVSGPRSFGMPVRCVQE